MTRDLMETKDNWIVMSMKRDELEHAQKTEGYWDDVVALFNFYFLKLRVALFAIVWVLFGIAWYTFTGDFDDVFGIVDFIVSALCAGGFRSLSEDSSSMQFIFTALYTTIGIPLIKISLGMYDAYILIIFVHNLMFFARSLYTSLTRSCIESGSTATRRKTSI